MVTPSHQPKLSLPSLDGAALLDMYRSMLLSRAIDEAELRLFQQQKAYFSISAAGHEAVQVAAAKLLRPGEDWFFPYYRDRALCLGLGVTPQSMFLQAMGKATDPSSGGRQMPSHWGDPALHIVSQSSPTGTQFTQAVGAAQVPRLARSLPPLDDRPEWKADELVYVSAGEGATSQGEFYEALSVAILERLPVLFLIQDNEYAISVPVEAQTPTGSLSQFLEKLPDLWVIETDGLDPVRSYWDLDRAIRAVRDGEGPVLVHAHVVRLFAHSNSDNDRDYKTGREREADRLRDPIPLFETTLLEEGIATPAELARLRDEVHEEVKSAVREAETAPEPSTATFEEHLFAPDPDPVLLEVVSPEPRPVIQEKWNLVEAIRNTLTEEMQRDPRIVVFGEDVADATRTDVLSDLRGKGGVFKVTSGLQRRFGDSRVFNSPLAEAGIVGRAVGMAVRGLRPVVEIQFFDYIWPAMHQIRNELGVMRWRSNGTFSAPVVIRVPVGGYLRGGSIYHSQSGESIFCSCPGLRVVMPSNARDAVGLLRTAIRSGDPVLFLEHKHLYRQPHAQAMDPGPDFIVPFGEASTVREGRDVTLVTYGAMVRHSLVAVEMLTKEGIEVEVIDLRSLSPYDFETIAASVKRTSRLIVATEEQESFGVSAEIAARAAEELFSELDAPVFRLGSRALPVGYNPVFEQATLPQISDVVDLARKAVRF